MFAKKTIRNVQVKDKKVLVRVDFNVPLKEGRVSDDTRIQGALPTLRYLLEQGAAVVLMSHLGRPKGKVVPELSLRPVAEHLSQLLGQPVAFAPDCVGPEAQQAKAALKPGEVLLLENTRFHPEEKKNDPDFARQLAAGCDLFVNDAFGSAHRAHASTVGVAQYLPAVAGFLMEKELRYLGQALESPARPFVAILGGAKISDKIGVVRNLLGKADRVLIGGGMANTFLAALGYAMGDSLVEQEAIETAKTLLQDGSDKLLLPVDLVIADAFAPDAQRRVVPVGDIPAGWRALDIGPDTVDAFAEVIREARTVVWNGPMGVFEMAPFAQGTFGIARAVAESDAVSIVGGGDSVAAVKQSGLADHITHLSTGGGASLEMLEGKVLPGVAALLDQ
ncbi:MAG TPA: phosphoglycerate kinase [Anaerolineales bacterium]|nr:phosphoglycerate kinase [Anaerolineales bacterium]